MSGIGEKMQKLLDPKTAPTFEDQESAYKSPSQPSYDEFQKDLARQRLEGEGYKEGKPKRISISYKGVYPIVLPSETTIWQQGIERKKCINPKAWEMELTKMEKDRDLLVKNGLKHKVMKSRLGGTASFGKS